MESNEVKVLDHGFVRLVDVMGDDTSIVQAARVSYGKGTKKSSDDEKLIRYLMKHGHTSPFEMVEFKFHIKLPIFVARQWIRHRTANVNEYSGRYSEMPAEEYIPQNGLHRQSTSNKQGSAERIDKDDPSMLMDLVTSFDESRSCYQSLLKKGVAKEEARIVLPLSTYTEWYWKIDLHNLFHFLKLRLDTNAQKEIREYAEVISGMVFDHCPIAYEAFKDYVLEAKTFSSAELRLLKDIIGLYEVNAKSVKSNTYFSKLSKREQKAFLNLFDLDN